MGKRKKIYNLRGSISDNALRIKYLLENIIYRADSELEKNVFLGMALDYAEDIRTCSTKIGRILKY